MMRIKEAIQRRKLIQQLNDEYIDDPTGKPGSTTPSICGRKSSDISRVETDDDAPSEAMTSMALHHFVGEFSSRLTENHRRALRVTWKRLSEAPKTSGRGTLQIMEKVFDRLMESDPEIMGVFYKSAFLKCIEDRKRRCSSGSIATLRDHAHLMIDFIDAIMAIMFDMPLQKPVWDPATIGRAHARLIPLGFKRQVWHKLGECFAEVMFSQECVRAYPHAASAWSMLSVAWTDKMYTHSRQTREMALQPYTPTSFSTWSDPSPYTAIGTPYGFGSQYNSPVMQRHHRARQRQRRAHTTPNSTRSSRSASVSTRRQKSEDLLDIPRQKQGKSGSRSTLNG